MASSDPHRPWFAVPAPIRNLFNHFPLHIYGPEDLPARAPSASRQRPALYVFVGEDDAPFGRPSYNPSCLKWQTMLRIAGIDVDLVPSNNHASPSGALPFLLPPSSPSSKSSPLTGARIHKYVRDHALDEIFNVSSPRLEAYQSLLTQNIRPAWLHALYILPANTPLLESLYLPSSTLLRAPIHHTLHAAATAEVLKTTRRGTVSPSQLYSDCASALAALSALLAHDDWFFGATSPGLFDADVFAYTHLMLDDGLAWQDSRLEECLSGLDNLKRHRERLHQRCWGEKTQ